MVPAALEAVALTAIASAREDHYPTPKAFQDALLEAADLVFEA